MKFFIPLGFRYGSDDNPYSHVGSVYGPYEDDNAMEEALARMWPNNKTYQFLVFEGQVVSVKPSSNEKPEDEKREAGNMENYVEDGDGHKCKDCGTTIIGATVAHPVWIRGFSGGGGEVKNETVPYCPNCEKKPDFHGAPVYED